MGKASRRPSVGVGSELLGSGEGLAWTNRIGWAEQAWPLAVWHRGREAGVGRHCTQGPAAGPRGQRGVGTDAVDCPLWWPDSDLLYGEACDLCFGHCQGQDEMRRHGWKRPIRGYDILGIIVSCTLGQDLDTVEERNRRLYSVETESIYIQIKPVRCRRMIMICQHR